MRASARHSLRLLLTHHLLQCALIRTRIILSAAFGSAALPSSQSASVCVVVPRRAANSGCDSSSSFLMKRISAPERVAGFSGQIKLPEKALLQRLAGGAALMAPRPAGLICWTRWGWWYRKTPQSDVRIPTFPEKLRCAHGRNPVIRKAHRALRR